MADRRKLSPEAAREARHLAWQTRRALYGERGHRGLDKGAYRRATSTDAIAQVHSPPPSVSLRWQDNGITHEVDAVPLVSSFGRHVIEGHPPRDVIWSTLTVDGRKVHSVTITRAFYTIDEVTWPTGTK